MGGDVEGPWLQTPGWHPYRWFGLDMRRWTDEVWGAGGFWEYISSQKLARRVLEERYGS